MGRKMPELPVNEFRDTAAGRRRARKSVAGLLSVAAVLMAGGALCSCGKTRKVHADSDRASSDVTVGVERVGRGPMQQQLTVSSELVPFQQIDVYAKESGYVKQLFVDYGSHVKAGQVMAVLEIPELELVLKEDDAAIKRVTDQVAHAEHDLGRVKAQHRVAHLQYERLAGVVKTQPGLVAQQEVDDAQGKDLALESQVEEAQSALDVAHSQLAEAQAKREHDKILYDYSKITAPFSGVVTQRFANLGTLVQAGTSSSTQALPIVRLSEDDRFRLVIPVPESYVRFIRIGDPVTITVPSMNKTYQGKVARFSVDVVADTRTMHTEVDVFNTHGDMIPGVYAEATLMLDRKPNALVVPLQAVNHEGAKTTVFIVNRDSKVEDRPVTLGVQSTNRIEVVSGLQDGDEVIVSDRSSLKPGQVVKPKLVNLLGYHESSEG